MSKLCSCVFSFHCTPGSVSYRLWPRKGSTGLLSHPCSMLWYLHLLFRPIRMDSSTQILKNAHSFLQWLKEQQEQWDEYDEMKMTSSPSWRGVCGWILRMHGAWPEPTRGGKWSGLPLFRWWPLLCGLCFSSPNAAGLLVSTGKTFLASS